MTKLPSFLPVALLALVVLPTGCHVNTNKNADGKDNVDIGTPFGSMHVKTDDKAANVQTGLTVYPGATMVKKDKDDSSAADVSMSFGNLSFGVHAVDLQTPDPEDKVQAFYRKDLARYGDVLTCKGKAAVGTPVRTSEGLTCGSNGQHIEINDEDQVELRAGSERHQHIVGLKTADGATRVSLVALDLPSGFGHHHESTDRE